MNGAPAWQAAKDQIARNFDTVAGRYDDTEAIFSGPIAARLVREAGIGSGDRVLDAGCGTGAALLPAAAAAGPGGQVTGVDLSDAMLDIARRRARQAGLSSVRLLTGDADDPPDPPCGQGSFDAIISSLVVYLLPDLEHTAARWLNLLRPGGVVAFSWQVSEDDRWKPALEAADSYVPDGFPRFRQLLEHPPLTSARQTEDMLKGCGYTGVHTLTRPFPMRYPSPQAWWDSGWSRARRIAWQHISPAQQSAARDDALAALASLADPADGSVTRTPVYGWTTAHRPR